MPLGSKNLAFVGQFVEIPGAVVFTVEDSVRAAQTAADQLLGIDRRIPPVTHDDKSIRVRLEAPSEAFE